VRLEGKREGGGGGGGGGGGVYKLKIQVALRATMQVRLVGENEGAPYNVLSTSLTEQMICARPDVGETQNSRNK